MVRGPCSRQGHWPEHRQAQTLPACQTLEVDKLTCETINQMTSAWSGQTHSEQRRTDEA